MSDKNNTVGTTWTVADLGFPRGGANPKRGDVNLLYGQIFSKLHENEKNWTEGPASEILPCRPDAGQYVVVSTINP